MPSPLRLSATVALLALSTACSSGDRELSDDLQRDLGEVRGSSIELAPRASDVRQVVSPEEQLPAGRVARTATPAPRSRADRASVREAQADSRRPAAPTEVAQSPAPQQPPSPAAQSSGVADTTSVTTAPRPRPAATAIERRGGYKSVGEIIREAPFPINP